MRMSGCLELSCTSISSGLPSLFRRTYTRLLLIGLVIYLYLSLFWKLHGVRPQNIQTDFLRPLLDHGRQSLEWTHSDQPIRRYSGDHDLDIDGVYIFKRELGYGYEGSARLYESKDTGEYVVIKTYYSNRFRDQLPDSLSDCFLHKITSWPTEIPAGLLMSAIFTVVPSPDSQTWSHVPMLDYFLAHTGSYFSSPKWHYVTPYIQHGTLVNLSQVAGSRNFVSLASLDQAWRPSFNKLLSTLATLHDAGYCHDDIKPDNVYIANATHWLLGDYGNLREINHVYHQTMTWRSKNQWADCQLNDVRRLMKTYMSVLRRSIQDDHSFDVEFYKERQPWSVMYWSFMRRPVGAQTLLDMHETVQGMSPGLVYERPASEALPVGVSAKARELAVTRELTCTGLKMSLLQWWQLGGFSGPRFQLERNNGG